MEKTDEGPPKRLGVDDLRQEVCSEMEKSIFACSFPKAVFRPHTVLECIALGLP